MKNVKESICGIATLDTMMMSKKTGSGSKMISGIRVAMSFLSVLKPNKWRLKGTDKFPEFYESVFQDIERKIVIVLLLALKIKMTWGIYGLYRTNFYCYYILKFNI